MRKRSPFHHLRITRSCGNFFCRSLLARRPHRLRPAQVITSSKPSRLAARAVGTTFMSIATHAAVYVSRSVPTRWFSMRTLTPLSATSPTHRASTASPSLPISAAVFTSNGRADSVTIFRSQNIEVHRHSQDRRESRRHYLRNLSPSASLPSTVAAKNATAINAADGTVVGTIDLHGKPEIRRRRRQGHYLCQQRGHFRAPSSRCEGPQGTPQLAARRLANRRPALPSTSPITASFPCAMTK